MYLSLYNLHDNTFKNTVSWTYVIIDLNGEEMLERFTKKNCKKQIKQSLELKKLSREKAINYMLSGKTTIVLLKLIMIKII